MRKPSCCFLRNLDHLSISDTREEDHAYIQGRRDRILHPHEPGMFEEYMRYLASTYKHLMSEYKKQGYH